MLTDVQKGGRKMDRKFQGPLLFLSNFYFCDIRFKGKTYPSSEHLFQSLKTLDPDLQERIRTHPPKGLKAFAKTIPLRDDWDDVKSAVMMMVLIAKFHQHPDLLEKLKAVPDEDLVEENYWGDTYWGVTDEGGKNMLGKLLKLVKYTL